MFNDGKLTVKVKSAKEMSLDDYRVETVKSTGGAAHQSQEQLPCLEWIPPIERSMARTYIFVDREDHKRLRETLLTARNCQISSGKSTVSDSNLPNHLNHVETVYKPFEPYSELNGKKNG